MNASTMNPIDRTERKRQMGLLREPAAARYQDGMNLYEYVRSDPIHFVDPTGLASNPTSNPASQPTTGNVPNENTSTADLIRMLSDMDPAIRRLATEILKQRDLHDPEAHQELLNQALLPKNNRPETQIRLEMILNQFRAMTRPASIKVDQNAKISITFSEVQVVDPQNPRNELWADIQIAVPTIAKLVSNASPKANSNYSEAVIVGLKEGKTKITIIEKYQTFQKQGFVVLPGMGNIPPQRIPIGGGFSQEELATTEVEITVCGK